MKVHLCDISLPEYTGSSFRLGQWSLKHSADTSGDSQDHNLARLTATELRERELREKIKASRRHSNQHTSKDIMDVD